MTTQSLLLSLVSIPLLAQVSPVALSRSTEVVPAFDSSGVLTLPAGNLNVDVAFPRGKKERRELTVVYEPRTGYYLWHITPINPNSPDNARLRLKVMKAQRAVAFLDSVGLIDFILGDGLFAKAWRRRADSLDAAVSSSINEIQQGLARFEGVGFDRDYKLVPVFGQARGFEAKMPAGYEPISRDFRCEPYRAACPDSVSTIAGIGKQGANWRLVLRNRFDVEVIVDQNFDLVGARQLTMPK